MGVEMLLPLILSMRKKDEEKGNVVVNVYYGSHEVKKEDNPGRPPKEWWDKMYSKIKEKNPSYDDEQIRKTVGNIWHNELSESKKKEIIARGE